MRISPNAIRFFLRAGPHRLPVATVLALLAQRLHVLHDFLIFSPGLSTTSRRGIPRSSWRCTRLERLSA
eukprot:6453010-Pyramimonas_sp.AAC.1